MTTATQTVTINHRDRAVLRAVAAGRCTIDHGTLAVDGIGLCDQFAGLRLTAAGLIAAGSGPAHLTAIGRELLAR